MALVEGGNLRLNLVEDSLPDVLNRSVEAFRARAEAEGIELSIQTPTGFPLVNMDRTRIAQVVSNLLENAIQHTPRSGRVELILAEAGPTRATITVSDTGEGIPAEELPNLFERFHRGGPIPRPVHRWRWAGAHHRQAIGRGSWRLHLRRKHIGSWQPVHL